MSFVINRPCIFLCVAHKFKLPCKAHHELETEPRSDVEIRHSLKRSTLEFKRTKHGHGESAVRRYLNMLCVPMAGGSFLKMCFHHCWPTSGMAYIVPKLPSSQKTAPGQSFIPPTYKRSVLSTIRLRRQPDDRPHYLLYGAH